MEDRVRQHFRDSLAVKQASMVLAPNIVAAARMMTRCLLDDGKILSAATAARLPTRNTSRASCWPLRDGASRVCPAMALTTDSSTLTSIANDYSFVDVFAKQVRALGHDVDVLLAISTSGNSENVLRAVRSSA